MVKIYAMNKVLFNIDISYNLFKKREEEVNKILNEYSWLPASTEVLSEMKCEIEELLRKEIQYTQRLEKLKKLNEIETSKQNAFDTIKYLAIKYIKI